MPTAYTDKYQPQSNVFSDKYSPQGNSFSDKYESRYGFIIQENLFYLLLEDGGKIIRQEQLDYENKYG
jgi:hypothetical protein